MATLNVKGFPDRLYAKLQRRAREQHRSVAQEVTKIVSDALAPRKPLSILDLKGLGKEVWQDVDAAAHVKRERGSWR